MSYETEIANERFDKARSSEMWRRIFNILRPEDNDLLSLDEVRKALRPTGEDYRGYKAVPIDKIIGSEGRYRDFSRKYLPKREGSRTRWTSIDRAHQKDVILPAVNLYEIAGYYFVRDGNHRVSVARTLGMEEIDAIIVRLGTEISLKQGVTKSSLKQHIIEYEREEFYKKTGFNTLLPSVELVFTETGRYNELIHHFTSHQHHLQKARPAATLQEAMVSWERSIYRPITRIITRQNMLSRFEKRTVADLYMWSIKHRQELQEQRGESARMRDVVGDLSKRYGTSKLGRALRMAVRLLRSLHR